MGSIHSQSGHRKHVFLSLFLIFKITISFTGKRDNKVVLSKFGISVTVQVHVHMNLNWNSVHYRARERKSERQFRISVHVHDGNTTIRITLGSEHSSQLNSAQLRQHPKPRKKVIHKKAQNRRKFCVKSRTHNKAISQGIRSVGFFKFKGYSCEVCVFDPQFSRNTPAECTLRHFQGSK